MPQSEPSPISPGSLLSTSTSTHSPTSPSPSPRSFLVSPTSVISSLKTPAYLDSVYGATSSASGQSQGRETGDEAQRSRRSTGSYASSRIESIHSPLSDSGQSEQSSSRSIFSSIASPVGPREGGESEDEPLSPLSAEDRDTRKSLPSDDEQYDQEVRSPISAGNDSEGSDVASQTGIYVIGPTTPVSAARSDGSISHTPVTAASNDSNDSNDSKLKTEPPIIPRRRRARPRTSQQELVRAIALFAIPGGLALPLSLLLHLTTRLLTPLYNSLPLTLHTAPLYAWFTLIPTAIYWQLTFKSPAQQVISAQVCFNIIAIAGDLVVVFGRRAGSLSGALFGPEWGALIARGVLGMGVVAGGLSFALLCYDHSVPVRPRVNQMGKLIHLANITGRAAAYVLQIYYAEQLWDSFLSGGASFLTSRPEKTILVISLIFTALSLLVRSRTSVPSSSQSFSTQIHSLVVSKLSLSRKASSQLRQITSQLPSQIFPIVLLLRRPLLVLAMRQQLYLRPSPPYLLARGGLRILHSQSSPSGQVVIGENLFNGYRFMRVDASLVGGRWVRHSENRTQLGDSIFATFPMQEIGLLAVRSDKEESLARTISMTTDLQVTEDNEEDSGEDKLQERALIIGLGAGISASAMTKRGLAVDVVEIDRAIYEAATQHFDLSLSQASTVNILSGDTYISQMAAYNRDSNGTLQKWTYVIHDCFSAGILPVEVYTKEFWQELSELVEVDGIVAVNIAGVYGSLAAQRIVVTLVSAFTQCRAFGDIALPGKRAKELVNMVVLCTMTHSPLLSFRPPNKFDVLRSPLRSHVYTSFHPKEIQLDSIVLYSDWDNPDMIIDTTLIEAGEGVAQVETSLATWRVMQQLLTPEMWMVW